MNPPRQEGSLVWDMGVCHTYWFDWDVRTKAPCAVLGGREPLPDAHSAATSAAASGLELPAVVPVLGSVAVRWSL